MRTTTSTCRSFLVLLAWLAAPAAAQMPGILPLAQRKPPLAVSVTPIHGTDATVGPTPLLADLDAGDLVAGRTWWEFEPGVVYVETYLGFLWSPAGGMSVFEVPPALYFFGNLLTSPADIARDRTVVGGVTNKATFETWPFRWTSAAGFELLEVPTGWRGAAADVSDDGDAIAGSVWPSLFAAPRAARWTQGTLAILGPAGMHSKVAAGSDDGRVLVGEIGPSAAAAHATRWVDGIEAGLAAVPGASTSSALHVSNDGRTAIGRASVGGQGRLVRWAPNGTAQAFAPPAGLFLETVRAINADGTAAVGALSDDLMPYVGNWVPYLWRASDGFHLLGELGLAGAYDLSEAVDVSDDGTRVVGNLGSWVFGPGTPQPVAFLWTETAGTLDLELLQQAAGGSPLGLYNAIAISGDGNRILAGGPPGALLEDSGAAILAFQGLP